MPIQTSRRDGVTVLSPEADMFGGPEGSALHDALHAAKADGPVRAVVDLAGVARMNSSGLGMLIAAYTTARNAEGDLRLAAVNGTVAELLRITRLDGQFRQFDTVDEAVASFAD